MSAFGRRLRTCPAAPPSLPPAADMVAAFFRARRPASDMPPMKMTPLINISDFYVNNFFVEKPNKRTFFVELWMITPPMWINSEIVEEMWKKCG